MKRVAGKGPLSSFPAPPWIPYGTDRLLRMKTFLSLIVLAVNTFATDFPAFRGVNYEAWAKWKHYDPRITERDLGYAKTLNVNQVRVFIPHQAYALDPAAFRTHLVHLARTCHSLKIGLMPVVTYSKTLFSEPEPHPLSRAWVQTLLDTIGNEPALTCWDVFNEPELCWEGGDKTSSVARARLMADIFRELDTRQPRTPVTIGWAWVSTMEQNADAGDVLSYHDYASTRGGIRRNIATALACGSRVNKPVLCTEIGCPGRANPYDIAIEEYAESRVGFYVWELMIVPGGWGDIHGIFYPDGTVRDPAIPAAMLGLFRNRSADIVLEFPDREGWVTRTVVNGTKWLDDPNGPYADGLHLAEDAAHLLEANQLTPMRDPPTRRVELLRGGPENPTALRKLLEKLLNELKPYRSPRED